MIKQAQNSIGTRVSDAAENALDATTVALEGTRKFASEAAGRIGDTARDLREGAVDLGRSGAESVSDAAVAGQRWVRKYARATRTYMEDAPVKSALIAAAVAAAVATIVTAMMSGRRDRN